MLKIILASKSKVRKKILDDYNILNEVKPSNAVSYTHLRAHET